MPPTAFIKLDHLVKNKPRVFGIIFRLIRIFNIPPRATHGHLTVVRNFNPTWVGWENEISGIHEFSS